MTQLVQMYLRYATLAAAVCRGRMTQLGYRGLLHEASRRGILPAVMGCRADLLRCAARATVARLGACLARNLRGGARAALPAQQARAAEVLAELEHEQALHGRGLYAGEARAIQRKHNAGTTWAVPVMRNHDDASSSWAAEPTFFIEAAG